MKRWERWSFNVLSVIVVATGIGYFYMKYLISRDDPFAVINHSWQPSMLALHIVVAPVLVLVFGIVLRSHIIKKLVSKHLPDRRTGWISLLSFAAMALSGYLLQVGSTPSLIRFFIVLHVVTSGVFVFGYGAHLVIGWRLLRASQISSSADANVPTTAQLPL